MVTSTFTRLLGPGDPRPFEIYGPGSGSPLLILCDHASATVPHRLGNLGLDEAALSRHIAWDIGAKPLTLSLRQRLGATAIVAGYSRLVIDCNRDPSDPTSIVVLSDDVIVPGNKEIDADGMAARANECFWPYHNAIRNHIDACLASAIVPALVFIHSFTPVYRRRPRPWHVGILWRADPRIPVPLLAALRNEAGVIVGDNEPYSARSGHDYSIEVHGAKRGIPHVAIEVRQDLIDTDHGVEHWAAILERALRPVLANADIYSIRHY